MSKSIVEIDTRMLCYYILIDHAFFLATVLLVKGVSPVSP